MTKINFTPVNVEGRSELYKKTVADTTRQYCRDYGERLNDVHLMVYYLPKIGYPYEERADGSVQILNKPISIGEWI
jgi:hypothetical protein